MARPSKKTVYERIEEQKNKILETEDLLKTLREELQELYVEKDDLEMHQLLDMMKANGLTIDKAAVLLQSPSQSPAPIKSEPDKENKVKSGRNKKIQTEETTQISLEIEDKIK